MAQPAGEAESDAQRLDFGRRLRLGFHGEMAAFGTSGSGGGGLKRLLMTHPPWEERVTALENANQELARSR